MKKLFISGILAVLSIPVCNAAPIKVIMNSISETMNLLTEDGTPINVGVPDERVYQLDVPAGKYVLSGIDSENRVNGSIMMTVEERNDVQEFKVFTQDMYVTNRDEDKNYWVYGKDYTMDVKVTSRDGISMNVTLGDGNYEYGKSVLVFSGNSINIEFKPIGERIEQGYMSIFRSGTVTFNSRWSGDIPIGSDFVVTLPKDAGIEVGQKGAHFTDFDLCNPTSTGMEGDIKKVTYHLAGGQKYNVRTWKKEGLTQALYFVKSDEVQTMQFTEADYAAYNPKQINHDTNSNGGYETGNIFVNINERNHLVMEVGEIFDAHAMRSWELTDTQIDNYFFEPDFHYSIINLDGSPSKGVIEISSDETTSSWRTIKAIGEGSVIVLVTYDAIGVTRNGKDTPYMGGQYWGAIWPENTAAYVITVGNTSSSIKPNMTVNEKYNTNENGEILGRLAGKNVDSEHDVFYYLDSQEGYNFTFKPEGVSKVEIAYPVIGEQAATYLGFGNDGVTLNSDGSYNVLLRFGRNIVKMTDASGKSVFQVLNAKPCHREIINETREGSEKFYPGDKIKIQYSGLHHPANKLAAVYNMSAYVTYNGIPNGSSLVLGSGQYTFGSSPSAQAVEIEIPEEYDIKEHPSYILNNGVIQVNGFGDPIGAHRTISKSTGRYPNFTAVVLKSYWGTIPDIEIPLTSRKQFSVKLDCNVENANISLIKGDKEMVADEKGIYTLMSGSYNLKATAKDYHCFTYNFEITDDMDETLTIPVIMDYSEGCWDGMTTTEPKIKDNKYQISTAAELAWLAKAVNEGITNQDAELTADIDLGNYEWIPIGATRSSAYIGSFYGNFHNVTYLNINQPGNGFYCGLFGFLGSYDKSGYIEGVDVSGRIIGNIYCGGISGYHSNGTITKCANRAEIKGNSCVAGISGYVCDTSIITDCYNTGDISAEEAVSGIGANNEEGLIMRNVLNIGKLSADSDIAPCALDVWDPFGEGVKGGDLTNLFGIEDSDNNWYDSQTTCDGAEIVSSQRMASGEIAYRLGEAFGQTIGEDLHPVLNGAKVYKVNYVLLTDIDENINLLDSAESIIYVNENLPEQLDGEETHWYEDAAMTQPVKVINCDKSLYLKLGKLPESINDILLDNVTNARWYNLQGTEITAPENGEHGIFIRVRDGRSEKIIL
ncbi:MAG: hypothetical protein NC201_01325 [Prevotella sp.]|nr:hypothetical protein [Bacteroides sp.]MCM1365869.1 hypothetical protein [Prevotella sp.]